MNIAKKLSEKSEQHPDKKAILLPVWNHFQRQYFYKYLTFRELESLSNYYANMFQKEGFKKGQKALLFVKPSFDFPALVFALFKLGVIPVLIDPGMGRANLLKAIERTKPEILIAIPRVHIARIFFKETFKTITHAITTGHLCWNGMKSIKGKKSNISQSRFNAIEMAPDETAAILYTSGGTGVPKGVVYTNRIFSEQSRILKEMFKLGPTDIDFPCFPLFSLFTTGMGMCGCIPDMDPSKPAKCNPKKIVRNIIDSKATFCTGSPAIWKKVADYCSKNKIILTSVKHLVMFGAPVRMELHQQFETIIPNGTTHTPYGATESLPVSCIDGKFLLKNCREKTLSGKGTCIGYPVTKTDIKIIKITNEEIKNIDSITECARFETGEIIVCSNIVTKQYFEMSNETALAKIYDDEKNIVWHRMGDLGYIDDNNLLWFCGRKVHSIRFSDRLLSSVQCEAIFNQHNLVARSALIKLNDRNAGIVIERKDGKIPTGRARAIFQKELIQLASKYPHTEDIKNIFFKKKFPVDVRHNIKIDRLKLQDEITRV